MADSDWDCVSEPGNVNQNYIKINNNINVPASPFQITEQYNFLSILFPESHPTHKYRPHFEARGVWCIDILRELDHEDLLELGVESRLDRKIILKRIQSASNNACIPLQSGDNALPEGMQESNSSIQNGMKNLATFRIVVGEARNPHRVMINHSSLTQSQWNQGESMTRAGWTHTLAFWAFPSKQPGTIRIAVGQALHPHRAMINHSQKTQAEWDLGKSMNIAGWMHHTEFWAFPKKQPGTIRIVAGEARSPHRLMINHRNRNQDEWNDPSTNMSIAGWGHKMVFWAYPDNGTP